MKWSLVFLPITLALAVIAWVHFKSAEAITSVGFCTAAVSTQKWVDEDRVEECSRVFTTPGIVLRANEPGKAYLPAIKSDIDRVDLETVYKVLIDTDTSGRLARKVPMFDIWWDELPSK